MVKKLWDFATGCDEDLPRQITREERDMLTSRGKFEADSYNDQVQRGMIGGWQFWRDDNRPNLHATNMWREEILTKYVSSP